jgi:hypothetical protein
MITAGLHEPEKLKDVLDDMLAPAPRSCRKLAAELGLDKMTVWAWRRMLSERLTALVDDDQLSVVATASTIARESRKASREWVDHARDPQRFPEPDRLRWMDYRYAKLPLPLPMARFRVTMSISVGEGGRCTGCVTPVSSIPCPAIALALGAMPSETAWQSPDGGSASSAGDAVHSRSTSGPDATDHAVGGIGVGQCPRAAASGRVVARLEQFLRPFRGPAIRHLRHYVGWFVARVTDGDGERWWNTLLGRGPTRFSDMERSRTA